MARESSSRKTDFISLDVKEKDLHELLKYISRRVGVNIIADSEVKEQVTLTLERVDWRDAIEVIARQTNCRIVTKGDRLIRFTQPPTINMEFHDADVRTVLRLLAKQAGVNIVLPADVRGKVSLSLRDVPWREALDTVAKAAGYVIVHEGRGSSGLWRAMRPR